MKPFSLKGLQGRTCCLAHQAHQANYWIQGISRWFFLNQLGISCSSCDMKLCKQWNKKPGFVLDLLRVSQLPQSCQLVHGGFSDSTFMGTSLAHAAHAHFLPGFTTTPGRWFLVVAFLRFELRHRSLNPTRGLGTRWCPPQLQMGYSPINYRYISNKNHSYGTYKPTQLTMGHHPEHPLEHHLT